MVVVLWLVLCIVVILYITSSASNVSAVPDRECDMFNERATHPHFIERHTNQYPKLKHEFRFQIHLPPSLLFQILDNLYH